MTVRPKTLAWTPPATVAVAAVAVPSVAQVAAAVDRRAWAADRRAWAAAADRGPQAQAAGQWAAQAARRGSAAAARTGGSGATGGGGTTGVAGAAGRGGGGGGGTTGVAGAAGRGGSGGGGTADRRGGARRQRRRRRHWWRRRGLYDRHDVPGSCRRQRRRGVYERHVHGHLHDRLPPLREHVPAQHQYVVVRNDGNDGGVYALYGAGQRYRDLQRQPTRVRHQLHDGLSRLRHGCERDVRDQRQHSHHVVRE